VEDTEVLEFEFLPEMANGSENAVLRLAVGFEGLLEEGARMLFGYQYDCTEQIMSALLPNALLYEYYTITGELDLHRKLAYHMNIGKGILKILSNQHSDGGWGWWKEDSTDAFMTAYVLFGLSRIRDAGFYVDNEVLEDASDALLERVSEDGYWAPAHWMNGNHIVMTIYSCNALINWGIDPSVIENSLNALSVDWAEGNIDDPYEVSLYALLLQDLSRDDSQVIDTLVSSITGSHWQAGSSLGGGDETTAWAAYAFWRSEKSMHLVRGALEWLAEQRTPSGGWGSTSDTIAAPFSSPRC